MNAFLSCGYTGLSRLDFLLNISVFVENGEYFYAEIYRPRFTNCDNFCRQFIIPHLKWARVDGYDSVHNMYTNKMLVQQEQTGNYSSIELYDTEQVVASRLFEWLKVRSGGQKIRFISSNSAFDAVHLIDLFGGNNYVTNEMYTKLFEPHIIDYKTVLLTKGHVPDVECDEIFFDGKIGYTERESLRKKVPAKYFDNCTFFKHFPFYESYMTWKAFEKTGL